MTNTGFYKATRSTMIENKTSDSNKKNCVICIVEFSSLLEKMSLHGTCLIIERLRLVFTANGKSQTTVYISLI